MKKYLMTYIKEIDEVLASKNKQDWEKMRTEHLIKINFSQHERLIHLIITLAYVLFMVLFFALSLLYNGFIIICFLLLGFIIFYIIHYFRLENGVQKLYQQYETMLKQKNKKSST